MHLTLTTASRNSITHHTLSLLCWAQMMRREADQHLDVIGHSVRHLGEMATTINVELTEQDQ